MNWMDILSYAFTFIIIPLLGIATIYLVGLIKIKSNDIKKKMDNELYNKYIGMLERTICDCVIATNQTYVSALKKQGKFDAEAQKIAFQMTYDSVIAILADDAKEYLVEALGDLEAYVYTKIEADVAMSKQLG